MGYQDIPSIGESYDQYAPQIYRYIYHRLGNKALAEDLTAEVFVRYIRSQQSPDNLVAYLYRCAHNLIVDYLRTRPQDLVPLDDRLELGSGDPAKMAEVEAERRCLRRAISRLTPDQQQVIVLKFVEGFSNKEIANVLDRPEGAVKALQHRALVNLRNLLAPDRLPERRLEFARLME